jgi:hypothetical protein
VKASLDEYVGRIDLNPNWVCLKVRTSSAYQMVHNKLSSIFKNPIDYHEFIVTSFFILIFTSSNGFC